MHTCSTRAAIIAALSTAAVTGLAIPAAPAATTLQVEAELGQSVIHSKSDGTIYLRLSLKSAARSGSIKRPTVNAAIVIDRSGSMQGDRIVAAKDAAMTAFERLSPDDIISLVAYNHNVEVLFPAGRFAGARSELERSVSNLRADGTTALFAGTDEGGRQVQKFISDNNVNRVVLLSDGLANVGPSSPGEVADLGRRLASKGISVTTIGLGLDYNEDLMQRLAAASDGNHAFVEHPRQLASIFDKEFGDALSVSARDIEIIIECRNGFEPVRVLGRDATISGSKVTVSMNQMQADNERYIVLELKPSHGRGLGDAEVADVEIAYLDLATSKREKSSKRVSARISDDAGEAEASLNKAVMSAVTVQVATEKSERAVELRDKGDVKGARMLLEENAKYLERQKNTLGSGDAAASASAVATLDELEKQSREAAKNLDEEQWTRTRKSMRYDQHKAKVQQKY